MTVNNELDINTLNWVKSEIDDTMKQARTSLESYIEDQQDESKILFCINYLHQVSGTLQMVELYGASLLAEELEKLAKAIHDDKVKNKEEAFEVLIRGSMQLPDYLEKLQSGQKDTPIVLLPLFNDMRAARNEALLSETSLFNPDLGISAPTLAQEYNPSEATKHIAELAKEKRHQFHLGLLGWFKNENEEKSLGVISDVLHNLRKVSEEQNTSRMLWVAEGLVDSLKHKGVDASVAVKSLVGQVDRSIKQIIDGGEVALAIEPPNDLLKNLLYYVAGSSADDSKTKEIKQSFNLAEVMPDTKTLEKARADLNAPNAALMDTVSGVLREDLQQVKDSLDIFMRSDDKNVEILMPVSEKLTSMADTLGMLSLGPQRKALLTQIDLINGLIDKSHEFNENELMDMASTIIEVEHTLDSMSEVTTQLDGEESSTDSKPTRNQPKTSEERKLLESVVAEAKVDINAVKESVSEFSRQLNHPEVLNSVPALLDKVRGSLNILQLDRAANLMSDCKDYVENHLLPSKTIPESETLDYLADTISSIEYYMESLVDSWGEPTAILKVAAESLELLGKSLDAHKPTVRDPEASQDAIKFDGSIIASESDDTVINLSSPLMDEDLTTDQAAMDESVDKTISDLAQPDFDEPETVVDLAQPDLELSENTEELVIEDNDTLQNIEPLEVEDSSLDLDLELDNAATQDLTLNDDDLQPIEGAHEEEDVLELDLGSDANSMNQEIERLDESLGLWFMDPVSSDVSSLVIEVIRNIEECISKNPVAAEQSKDPLKITNDMKQTIHRVGSNDEVFSDETEKSMLWARDALTEYFNDLELANDENISLDSNEDELATKSSDEINESVEEDTSSSPIEIDDEIFEIFLEEAEEEYENISKNLPLWKENLDNSEALSDMRRSFHTLKGSGRLVGAKDLGEFAWAFEGMLNRVIDKTISVTPELLELVDRGRVSLPILYGLFKTDQRPDQQIFSLMEHADSLSRGESFTPLSETISSMSIPQPDLSRFDAVSSDSISQSIEDDQTVDKIQRPDIDSVLLEIYRKEVATHLLALRNYIRDWHENDIHEVTEALFRALHTLTGSARTTGVDVVSDLCLALEHYIKLLQAEELLVSNEGVAIFEESANRIDAICSQLGEQVEELYTTSDLVQKINELMATLENSSVVSDTENNETNTGKGLNSISIESDLTLDDYDEELLEIFIEEGLEILDESDHTLHAWAEERDNNEHIEALQRQLHTLKGGARMSGVTEIGDLSHRVESLIFSIVDGTIAPEDNVFKVLQHAQDNLVDMLDKLKNHQLPHSAQSVLDEIDNLIGDARDDQSLDQLAFTEEDEGTNLSVDSPDLDVPEVNDLTVELEQDENTVEADSNVNDLSIELTEELTSLAEELDAPHSIDIPELDDELVLNDEQELNDEPEVNLVTSEEDSPLSSLESADDSLPVVQDEEVNDEFPIIEVDEATPQKTAPADQVRVRADTLNNLVNFAGEVSIYRSRLEQQVNSFRFNLQELDETVDRFRGQLRTFEIETEAQIQTRKEETLSAAHEHFDPLEFDRFTQMQQISRSMLESMNDIDSLRSILSGLNRESETLLVQQSRVNTELQEGLMSTRLVPFEKQVNRLKRIVRQTSNEVDKQAVIKFEGTELELDRAVVERMMPPIEHMLRNAIAHGIETPEQRKASGKNEQGNILLQMSREGGDVVIQIIDDGAGIDAEAIRSKAIEKGLIKENATVSDKHLIDMILESGFSTADEITQIAGRGVGMDVVNNEIKQLGGVLNIDTVKGEGTTFTVSMPLSLAVSRALMIYVGDSMYAVPLMSVEGVERLSYEQLVELQSTKNSTYNWVDEEFHYIHLGQLMDGVAAPVAEEGSKAALLMVRSGNFRAALHIEGLVGSREIVIKPVGPQLSSLRGISGATIMGDGSVVLILDLGVLIRLALTENEQGYLETEEPPELTEAVAEEDKTPTVMVVDDSITVRKVTSRFLERNELDVILAKDGIDALTQLLDVIPDVMLLDVEMPRMDGFELAINMRNDERLKDIPIIMITSRTGQKHRDRAMNIGVNLYMGKPYNESELLENIHSLVNADK